MQLTDNQLKKKQSREQALHYRQQALQAEKRRANQLATTKSPTNKMIVMVRTTHNVQHLILVHVTCN